MNNIYKLELTAEGSMPLYYDFTDSVVVIAARADEARKIAAEKAAGGEGPDAWLEPKRSKLTNLGYAQRAKAGLVIRSFNAG